MEVEGAVRVRRVRLTNGDSELQSMDFPLDDLSNLEQSYVGYKKPLLPEMKPLHLDFTTRVTTMVSLMVVSTV